MAKDREKEAKLDAKKAADAKKKLDAELFKTAQVQQKIPFGTGESILYSVIYVLLLIVRSKNRMLPCDLSRALS